MSFGRQPPPKPRPGRRKVVPIRESAPRMSDRTVTFPSAVSHTSAMALMKEIFVARKAFAATFASSGGRQLRDEEWGTVPDLLGVHLAEDGLGPG